MLPADCRLHTPAEFSAVVRGGVRVGGRRLVVHLRCDPAGAGATSRARAGFVVSSKVGNAVIRHRLTRQLRPLLRERLGGLPPGTDVVVRVLPEAAGSATRDLAVDLDDALVKVRRRWDRRVAG